MLKTALSVEVINSHGKNKKSHPLPYTEHLRSVYIFEKAPCCKIKTEIYVRCLLPTSGFVGHSCSNSGSHPLLPGVARQNPQEDEGSGFM
jgi:hypothetical protein